MIERYNWRVQAATFTAVASLLASLALGSVLAAGVRSTDLPTFAEAALVILLVAALCVPSFALLRKVPSTRPTVHALSVAAFFGLILGLPAGSMIGLMF